MIIQQSPIKHFIISKAAGYNTYTLSPRPCCIIERLASESIHDSATSRPKDEYVH